MFNKLASISLLALSKVSHLYAGFNGVRNSRVIASFDWSSIEPATYLDYASCYDGFECARLEVPVDWTDRANTNKAQIAIIRLPAAVPPTDPSFGGTILLNPGGPGGSGIDLMRWTGYGIRDILDGEKHFELLSWDPRGIHHTTPIISCFENEFQREVWQYRNSVLGPMEASNSSLLQKWALSEGFGNLCGDSNSTRFPDGSVMAQFTTTALVARDMLEIVDQVELNRLRYTDTGGSEGEQQRPNCQRPNCQRPALLNYWGYSYGSYLGNTFASMFPSRIGRMILDSVVDADDYTATGWFSNLQDYDKILTVFFQDCFHAGSLCPLNSGDVTSPNDLAVKVDKLLQNLTMNPMVLHHEIPNIVTFADVSLLMLSKMYSPTWSWIELADILADLLQGNATRMGPYLPNLNNSRVKCNDDEIDRQLLNKKNETQPYPPFCPIGFDAGVTTLCNDGDEITNLTLHDWVKRLAVWRSQSSIVGWAWGEHTMPCAHWPKAWRPDDRNRFRGPWTTKLEDYDPRASPLLLIGGTADPVLPLRNAYKAAARHEGAQVLVQDAPGHCSGYINPVKCTWARIGTFFAEGILPENGTVCMRDGTPWTKA